MKNLTSFCIGKWQFHRGTSVMLLMSLLVLGACSRQNLLLPTETIVTEKTAVPADSSPTVTASTQPDGTLVATFTPTQTAQPDCLSLGGEVMEASIPSQNMKGELKFHIYLPPCYDQDTSKRFPVLYLIHGQSFNDDQWVRLGAPQTADQLIAGGLPPFIIVMPFDKYHYRQPTADPFDEAMIDELIPYIDATYRTIPDRASRAVGGLSRGGGWALHFALTHPEMFGAFGGHSLAILDEDGTHLSRLLDAIPPEEMPRIFMDIGKSDGLRTSAEKFEAQLTERGIPHEWYMFPGYHNEKYWSSHVEEYLKWYTSGWAGE
jgi:enterochelin esterase-like enzyme